MASTQPWTRNMTPKDKRYYQALGQRIAVFRKDQDLTQQQLAEILGISQQTMAHYEGGRLRVAVVMLTPLARALAVSIEELVGENETTKKGKNKRGPMPVLQRQIEQISQLPRAKQKFVIDMLDTVIKQAS